MRALSLPSRIAFSSTICGTIHASRSNRSFLWQIHRHFPSPTEGIVRILNPFSVRRIYSLRTAGFRTEGTEQCLRHKAGPIRLPRDSRKTQTPRPGEPALVVVALALQGCGSAACQSGAGRTQRGNHQELDLRRGIVSEDARRAESDLSCAIYIFPLKDRLQDVSYSTPSPQCSLEFKDLSSG